MEIDKKIEEMRSKLMKTVMGINSRSKEEAVKLLEEFGLNNEYATKLLVAYRNAEDAKQTAQNVWDSAWNSRSGIDYSTDIAKTQQKESDTRTQFESINAECALLMIANAIEPSEINDEILNKLFEEGIQETQISNPALRVTFHYYTESKAKDVQRKQDLEKVQEYSTKIGSKMTNLEAQLRNEQKENETLRNSNEFLKSSYENLQTKFQARIDLDEKKYQVALTQIRILKDKLKEMQKRGILRTIGDKLFGSKKEKLPEAMPEIPDTLFQSKSEKMGMQEFEEAEIFFMMREKNSDHKDINNEKTSEEVQEQ